MFLVGTINYSSQYIYSQVWLVDTLASQTVYVVWSAIAIREKGRLEGGGVVVLLSCLLYCSEVLYNCIYLERQG